MPLLLALLACAPRAQVQALSQENAQLRADLQVLQVQAATCEAELATLRPPDQTEEDEAMALLTLARDRLAAGEGQAAREALEDLTARHPDTRAARSAARDLSELSIVGAVAPALEVDRWLQGQASGWSGTTLVVFFEVWCPHCKRELPKLQALYEELGPRGLQVVALTRLTKTSTEADTLAYLDAEGLRYPVAVETGSLTEAFVVTGIPAAAIVEDGQITWRGHPARIDAQWLAARLD